jgi:hypothetical protein
MKRVNIFALENGVGISRDVQIVKHTLQAAGYEVHTSAMYGATSHLKYDINIWLERFNPKLLTTAHRNVMIPNQEWFDRKWLPFLPHFHLFLTKTKFADNIFKNFGVKTHYTSFTSDDRYLGEVVKDYSHWLHVAGKSIQKQTDIIVRTWARNPGFPQLTILQDPKMYKPRNIVRNINMMYDRLPDATLKHLQNAFGVHVCPSETEGFGHYINEGLSCKSVVIATGAPPMDELVTTERGVLVDAVRQEPMNFSTKYIISEASLERAVVKAMIMEDRTREELGLKARSFFDQNDAFFKNEITEAISKL